MKSLVFLLISLCVAASLDAQPAVPATESAEDTFRFREGGSRELSVTLNSSADGFELLWPEHAKAEWDTALLKLHVSTSAQTVEPYVEIVAGTQTERQYFRSDDSGPRWINLSFLRDTLTPGETLRLSVEGVDIQLGSATLRLFDNDVDLSQTILVLAPHPDDAEIAAFGLYANRASTIVTVTSGNGGPRSYDSSFEDLAAMYHFKGRLRLIDSITIPWLGGIPPERAFNMSYFNGRLRQMHGAPNLPVPETFSANTNIGAYLPYNIGSLLPKQSRTATWNHLIEDLTTVLNKIKPSIIVAPHPQLDVHRDHQFTTVALAEALLHLKTDVTLLLYTNHADKDRYPYGPAGTAVSLPPPLPQAIQLERIYSHPVSADTQRLKLFALEAMHDLRPSPSRLYQMTKGDDRTVKPEQEDPEVDTSYLRRGPRSNEMFYVYSAESFKRMIEAFLEN